METWYLRILEILEQMMLDYNGKISTYEMLSVLRKEIVAAEERRVSDEEDRLAVSAKLRHRPAGA